MAPAGAAAPACLASLAARYTGLCRNVILAVSGGRGAGSCSQPPRVSPPPAADICPGALLVSLQRRFLDRLCSPSTGHAGHASVQRDGGGRACARSLSRCRPPNPAQPRPAHNSAHAALLMRLGSSWSLTAQSRSARQSRLAAAAFENRMLAVSRSRAVEQLESPTSWLHCSAACRGPATVNAPLP